MTRSFAPVLVMVLPAALIWPARKRRPPAVRTTVSAWEKVVVPLTWMTPSIAVTSGALTIKLLMPALLVAAPRVEVTFAGSATPLVAAVFEMVML